MAFKVTTALNKMLALSKRVRVIQGGTSAGKTYGIVPILIDIAIGYTKSEISVVSETIPHLRKGAMRDFLKIMEETGRFIPDHWNKSTSTYNFTNGSYIEFFSADTQDKVRGPRRDVLYINECNNIDFETYSQLAIRTRDTIFLDYNPTHEFWANTELNDDDTERLILTYKDNESLSETIIKEIEKARQKAFFNEYADDLFSEKNIKSSYWANWWKVYGLGLVGSVEGVIFTNWKQIHTIPDGARLLGYGMDFGFTNDPTTIVAMYRYDGKIIFDEICYRTGLTNNEIANIMKSNGIQTNDSIIADCAEPKSIAEINRHGFHVIACEKGADSVRFGIDILRQNEMLVTDRSTNIVSELRQYVWETDRNGNTTNRPIDAYNHAIDAMRYIATKKLARLSSGGVSQAIAF